MPYKIIKIFIFIFLVSCVSKPLDKEDISSKQKSFFLNKGFALVYNDDLYEKKIINSKIEERSLIIFQKNLKKDTSVKVTNLLNSNYIIAKVGKKVDYPFFYNSVLSKRISEELNLNQLEPYVEIKEIIPGESFVAKKAKTYEEEKNVADKAPVEEIEIKDLGSNSGNNKKKIKKSKFNYIIKIADFYFVETAKKMESIITEETSIQDVNIDKISSTKFRVFLGPFDNINSLKKTFNAINVLEFDSIEIIKK